MQTNQLTKPIRHGAFALLQAHAPETVIRREILRDEMRAPEARVAAAEWLVTCGSKCDRVEAGRFLSKRHPATGIGE